MIQKKLNQYLSKRLDLFVNHETDSHLTIEHLYKPCFTGRIKQRSEKNYANVRTSNLHFLNLR